jgi:arsenite transporter
LALAWAFLPDKRDYREGLILVGLARCIAMVLPPSLPPVSLVYFLGVYAWSCYSREDKLNVQVLVWNDLAGGDGDYCAILVAFNSILQMILYAPFAIFYINVVTPPQSQFSPVEVSYSIVAQSVAVFLGIPHP